MSTYDILVYLLKHHNNRVCGQQLNKFSLDPTSTSPVEKSKCIEQYFPNLSLLNQGNWYNDPVI